MSPSHATISNVDDRSVQTREAMQSQQELDRAIDELRGIAARGAEGELSIDHSLTLQIPLQIAVVLGRADLTIADLAGLAQGSTVKLDRKIGDKLELTANGVTIANGEIITVDKDRTTFGFRVTNIL